MGLSKKKVLPAIPTRSQRAAKVINKNNLSKIKLNTKHRPSVKVKLKATRKQLKQETTSQVSDDSKSSDSLPKLKDIANISEVNEAAQLKEVKTIPSIKKLKKNEVARFKQHIYLDHKPSPIASRTRRRCNVAKKPHKSISSQSTKKLQEKNNAAEFDKVLQKQVQASPLLDFKLAEDYNKLFIENKTEDLRKQSLSQTRRKLYVENLAQQPQNKQKYTFEMLHEDDSTDEEDKESYRRPLPPTWSRSHKRGDFVLKQEYIPSMLVDSFFSIKPMAPDMREIFPDISKQKLKRRDSSMIWATPPRYSELPIY